MKLDVLRVGLCQMQVCATKDCSEPFIEEDANRQSPSGIESPWHIRRNIEPVYVQCHEDPDRHHVILEC